jgi:formylglycine-generating enzyme
LTGSTTYSSSEDYLTNVGAYPNSLSAYGTLDQGGDVWQWTESVWGGWRELRGGDCGDPTSAMISSCQYYKQATYHSWNMGFRVASAVPEPGSIAMLFVGAVSLLAYYWQRRHI